MQAREIRPLLECILDKVDDQQLKKEIQKVLDLLDKEELSRQKTKTVVDTVSKVLLKLAEHVVFAEGVKLLWGH